MNDIEKFVFNKFQKQSVRGKAKFDMDFVVFFFNFHLENTCKKWATQ